MEIFSNAEDKLSSLPGSRSRAESGQTA